MGKSQYTDEDYDLWVLLAQARDAMFKVRQRELKRYGVSTAEANILLLIKNITDKTTITEIAQPLIRETHTVSEVINRMQKRGLLRKVHDLDRSNKVGVELTDKGKKAYRQSLGRKSIHRIMLPLSKNKRQQLRSSMKELRDRALKELGKTISLS